MDNEIIAKAPGVIKLLGEHAVVYGKLCLAVAIKKYATVRIERTQSKGVEFDFLSLPGYKPRHELSLQEIESIYKDFASRNSINEFIEKRKGIDPVVLPYAAIIGDMHANHGIEINGIRIIISSDIPPQQGLASSAACCTALAVAVSRLSQSKIPAETLIEIARNGEKIIHANENAGRIDVNTSFYGNCVGYSAEKGVMINRLKSEIPLLLIDTGPKKKTSEMVVHVSQLYKEKKDEVDAIMASIDDCSVRGLDCIKKGNLPGLGSLMYEDQELLRLLGVSSDGIDKAVEIAKNNGAYGAKLSGGGGGGIAIAMTENKARLSDALARAGFRVFDTGISLDGAANYA